MWATKELISAMEVICGFGTMCSHLVHVAFWSHTPNIMLAPTPVAHLLDNKFWHVKGDWESNNKKGSCELMQEQAMWDQVPWDW